MKALRNNLNGSVPQLARAIVRAIDDPDKQGRVKVEYPWYNGSSGQMPSEWARLCLPYASNENGLWLIPEVGDEVIVFFDNGNIDSPIVMGSMYGQKSPPPQSGKSDNGQNNLRFLKTKGGHLLCFDDSGEGGITLQTKGGSQIEIKDDGISIKSKGGGEVSVKDSTISINAASTIELGQGAAMSLIKGETFQALFNSHVHGTAWGPSTPPMMPMTPAMLSMKVKTV